MADDLEEDDLGEPDGKWAVIKTPTGLMIDRVWRETELGEEPYGLHNTMDYKVLWFFRKDVQEVLQAWSRIGGDGQEIRQQINDVLMVVCHEYATLVKSAG